MNDKIKPGRVNDIPPATEALHAKRIAGEIMKLRDEATERASAVVGEDCVWFRGIACGLHKAARHIAMRATGDTHEGFAFVNFMETAKGITNEKKISRRTGTK